MGGSDIAGFIDNVNKTIYVNRDDSLNRQRFTIAHELGHYLLHQQYLSGGNYRVLYRRSLSDGQVNSPEEQEANAFAANLLVPAYLLKIYKNYPQPTQASLFGVSEEVIRNRKI